MSFGSTDAAPQPKPKALNIAPERTSTNEEARPVPIGWGQFRLATTWLANALNVTTEKVTEEQQAGKGDSQTVTKGIEYYADLASAICLGPCDHFYKLWLNGVQAWRGDKDRGGGTYAQIEIEGRGPCYLHWGVAHQNPDIDEAGHPNYKFQTVLVMPQFFFGIDTTSAPSIEVELGRWPSFGWLTGGNSKVGSNCNPIAIIADALTHPLLFDLPESALDTAQLRLVAQELKNEGVGLSPVITSAVKLDQFLAEICSYFDAAPRWVGGRLQIILQKDAPDRSTLLTVDEGLLIDPPEISAVDWSTTKNQTRVVYTRRDNDYKEAAYTWTNEGNILLTGSTRAQTLQRPWITSQGIAQRIASRAGRIASTPRISGRCKVMERPVRKLRAGDFFRLRYTLPEIDLVCKIIERRIERPNSREVEFVWEAEPTQDGDNTDETDPRDEFPEIAAVPFARLKLLELPWPLTTGVETIGALAARGNSTTDHLSIWASTGVADYSVLGSSTDYVVAGVLAEALPAGGTISSGTGVLLDCSASVDQRIAAQTLNAALLNTTLLFIGGEICSIADAQMIAPGQYRLGRLVRGRYDTVAAAHAVGAVAYVVRSYLCTATSDAFRNGQTWNFKVQPLAGRHRVELADIAPVPLTLQMVSLRPVSPRNFAAGGVRTAPTFTVGADKVFTWSRTSWRNPSFFELFAGAYTDPDVTYDIELISGVSTIKRTISRPAGSSDWTYTAAMFAADFPSTPSSYQVRLWARWNSYRSTRYQELTLTP